MDSDMFIMGTKKRPWTLFRAFATLINVHLLAAEFWVNQALFLTVPLPIIESMVSPILVGLEETATPQS
jgi:hypothetical protein